MTGNQEDRKIVKHRKVRTGCEACKRRRVKCDEARPTCGNCSYHSHVCIYRQMQPSYPIFGPLTANDLGIVQFSARDLGLVHHWTVSTAETIGATEELRSILRDPFLSVALEKPYLLYVGALSVNACDPSSAFSDTPCLPYRPSTSHTFTRATARSTPG